MSVLSRTVHFEKFSFAHCFFDERDTATIIMVHRLYLVAAFGLTHCGQGFVTLTYFRPPVSVTKSSLSRTIALHESKQTERPSWTSRVTSDPDRSIAFSGIMALCGATLGPFLDSFHSAFGVLQYEDPITATLWGTAAQPGLTTAFWVPALFGLAGFIIGWLYIILDSVTGERTKPSPPLILVGISIFTFQYWLSGALYSVGVDRTTILAVMTAAAGIGFSTLDRTMAGFLTSSATAIGGPLSEVGLLSSITGHGGYQYLDKGETGFFPLWIVPGK